MPAEPPCTGVSNLAPVGTPTSGAGLWGQLDLGGNVWEWNLDWYAAYVTPSTNCADLVTASERVCRGGSFLYATSTLLPPNRSNEAPASRNYDIGLRCARTP